MKAASISLVALAALLASPAAAQFSWRPPGELEAPGGGGTRPGAGRVDDQVYAPGMRFPIEAAPAYANSQIYGHGGYMGPGGGQCESANYAYPWHDNYCEERSWTMPMCPSGQGHQGQDIRPATCADDTHWAVAADDGTITNIGSYSVYVTADDGRRYDYLHMRSVQVTEGQRVSRGQRIGRVSNAFGGTSTTIHLHFNVRMNVSGYGNVYAPTYMSLVRSYEELVGPAPWSAAYADQSFPLASHPFELAPGEEAAGYIELRNIGGETWEPGQTFLGTSEPRDGASPLAHPSWVSDHRAATVDRAVPPGEIGRFAFTVRAPTATGDYPQYFNLVQEGVAWFSDSGLPPDDQLQVRVTVVDPPACPADLGAEWGCEGASRIRCGADDRVEREPCPVACVLGACTDGEAPDADGDGHDASVDCDDGDPAVHPGATEICGDGVDQDCDGADTGCGDASVPLRDAGASAAADAGEGGGISGDCSCGAAGAPSGRRPLAWVLVVAAAFVLPLRRRRPR